MSGDYSRVRFDPGSDLSGVLMQQGRVQLDADWNEWVAVLDRRQRAESVDTFGVHPQPGISGVAVVSPQTPDAFKIEASGGSITIGRGRMYVDGLLAENHGGGAQQFDPVLAELRGQTALAYNQQPYFPAPPALPVGGPHLAYLEVWQREVTYLQQPKLVETAVGVDTTTRMQTVWQTRVLSNFGADCTSPDAAVAAWDNLIRPSGGRLSVKAEGVPPDLDPCELPPSGGYRGLENQLYRIEIHTGGAVGTANFKWSRDNASVASNVVEIVSQTATATELKLASLGRDEVLRFNTGNWVEIIDDSRELSGENGDPALRRGLMRKITVDDAKQTISFSPALPANLIPSGGSDTLATRHTRVRRWDQSGTVRDANNNILVDLNAAGSSGLIPVPAAGVWVVLENGIQVQFSLDPSGNGFHCQDYWVSAARTADTSVEAYTNAPPRGIHRHYARLAIVTFPDIEHDCRTHWPPECGGCCTINVAPGESIQTALDSLPDEGGCVCLKTGVHNIAATIRILSSRIILRGESPGAIVNAAGLAQCLQIGDADSPISDIIVTGIRFKAAGSKEDNAAINALMALDHCTRVRVEYCSLVSITAARAKPPSALGISLNNVTDIDLVANRLDNFIAGILSHDFLGGLRVTDNAIAGSTGASFGKAAASLGQFGIRIDSEHTQACRIENNRIRDFWTGISLRHNAEASVIAGNCIMRSFGNTTEPFPSGVAAMRQYLDNRLYAIDVEAAHCQVRNNKIDLHSAAWGGIRASGAHTVITANSLEATAKADELKVPAGIYCTADAKNGVSADHAIVRNNLLGGAQAGIVVSRIVAPGVHGNHIDGTGGGWFGVWVDDCTDARIGNNDLREVFFAVNMNDGERNHIADNHIDQTLVGAITLRETNLSLSGNTLQSCQLAGMVLFARGSNVLIDNRVLNCGFAPGTSIGIGVYAEEILAPSAAHLRIENCEVLDTGISVDGNQVTTVNAMSIGGWMPACQIIGNRVGYTQPDKLAPQNEHRALLLLGAISFRSTVSIGSAQVNDNHFRGPGRTHLVEFVRISLNDNIDFRFEKVTFNNNVCDHLSTEPADKDTNATVNLWGGQLIAMGNHVKSAPDFNAMSLSDCTKIALMGNITTGDYIQTGTVTPAPIFNFNVRI